MGFQEHKRQFSIGSVSTSEREIWDILKAWLAVSAAFAIVLNSGSLSGIHAKFIIASLTVGIGFLFHELGHKLLAQKYGCFAEFRSFDTMLILALAMSFFGVVFAAPGAVFISGKVNARKNGKISAVGPAVNLALALVFLALIFLDLPNLFKSTAYYGFLINSWLALFNMIPFWMFDGYKVLKWSKPAYAGIVGMAVLLILVQNFVLAAK